MRVLNVLYCIVLYCIDHFVSLTRLSHLYMRSARKFITIELATEMPVTWSMPTIPMSLKYGALSVNEEK